MSNRQQFSEYASLKATDRLISRLSPRRTSPRMRNSPSMAETQGRSPERDSSFQTPVISDLQAAYAKALNTIDTLKAEKAHMKVWIMISVYLLISELEYNESALKQKEWRSWQS